MLQNLSAIQLIARDPENLFDIIIRKDHKNVVGTITKLPEPAWWLAYGQVIISAQIMTCNY